MSHKSRWIAKQIKNSDKELAIDVDTDEDRLRLQKMADIHERQVAELKANPTMALARISEQKVYFTAEELYLSYGHRMKPAAYKEVDELRPEALTKYDDIFTNTDQEFWEEVSRIEGY